VREQPHRLIFFFFDSLLVCDLVALAPIVSEGCPYTFIGTVFFGGFGLGLFGSRDFFLASFFWDFKWVTRIFRSFRMLSRVLRRRSPST